MSESAQAVAYPLAYLESGDPAPVPTEAQFFRIKVTNGRRADLVRTEFGLPRLIPVTTTPEEFRRIVSPGRYRLEPVLADGTSIEKAPPAVVIINEQVASDVPRVENEQGLLACISKHQKELAAEFIHQQTQLNGQYLKLATALAEQTQKLAEQNQQLVSTIASHFGEYLTGSAKLLRAAHPAVEREPPRNALTMLEEHQKLQEVVDSMGGNSRTADLIEKSIDGTLPLLKQVIHRWVLGLSSEQSAALLGQPPANEQDESAEEPDPDPDQQSQIIAHLNAIEKHLTAHEVAVGRAAIAAMTPEQIREWQTALMSKSPEEAAALIRLQIETQADD